MSNAGPNPITARLRGSRRWGGNQVKVALDSNIWRRVVDAGAGAELLAKSVRSKVTVAVAPTVVYEALRTPGDQLRAQLLTEMLRTRWLRLMPEAFSESMEVLNEIERLRPSWLRPKPKISEFRQLKADWTKLHGGCWDRMRFETADEIRRLQKLGDLKTVEEARKAAYERRQEMAPFPKLEHLSSSQLDVKFGRPTKGWRGDAIGLWRVEGLAFVTRALQHDNHAYLDWLRPFIDPDAILSDAESWNKFWFYETSQDRMPRFWLRSAIEFQQRFRKVTPGTPGDSALTTHLLEVDYLLTEDRALGQIVEKVTPTSPLPLARVVLLRASIDSIFNRIEECGADADQVTKRRNLNRHKCQGKDVEASVM